MRNDAAAFGPQLDWQVDWQVERVAQVEDVDLKESLSELVAGFQIKFDDAKN